MHASSRNGMCARRLVEIGRCAGDLVWVSTGQLPHDAVLLVGSCTVDESPLTGEPDPVHKSPYADVKGSYIPEHSQSNTLFAGTHVLHVSHGPPHFA